MTREEIIEAATKAHDEQGCGCDRKYLMSCPRMAQAILGLAVPVETPEVTVKVSRELLGELAEWSEPVQVMVTRVGGEYDMIFRRHECPTIEAGAAA